MGSELPGWKDGKPPPARTAWQKEIGGGCKRCKRGFMAFVWEGEPMPEFCLECERLNYEERIATLERERDEAREDARRLKALCGAEADLLESLEYKCMGCREDVEEVVKRLRAAKGE